MPHDLAVSATGTARTHVEPAAIGGLVAQRVGQVRQWGATRMRMVMRTVMVAAMAQASGAVMGVAGAAAAPAGTHAVVQAPRTGAQQAHRSNKALSADQAPIGHRVRPFPTLAYEPVALAWSADEVERATDEQLDTLIRQAHAAGELGCQDQCDRLHALFDRLLPLARSQTAHAASLTWTLTVVRSSGVDALALPGGHVVVSEAFVRDSGLNDAALAFVIAHEMAHCILQHERQALTVAHMLLPANVFNTVSDVYTELDFNFKLLKALEPAMQQGELEADELGLLLAAAAGHAPGQQLRFIEREAAQPPGPKPLVRTHPPAQQRLARLRERLPLAERLHQRALDNAAALAVSQGLQRARSVHLPVGPK
jgi:Zn-dependent protease with chaperone function